MRRDETTRLATETSMAPKGKEEKMPYDNVHVTPSIAALLCIDARAVLEFRSV